MIRDKLKSVLRDKKSLIYIVVFIIISIILNISINMENVINSHYDNKINEYIEIANQELAKENIEESIKDKIDYQELIRTVQTMDGKQLNDEQKNKLKNMKHVEEIRCEEIKGTTTSLTINYIIVDDWKNCEIIQKYLNSQGIQSYVDTMGIDKEILKNYKIQKNFSNIIKYMMIIMTIIIVSICCKNIVKNEEKNYQLLKIFGYKKENIKLIIFSQLAIILIIGFASGYFIYRFLDIFIKI